VAKWNLTQQWCDENGYPGMELERMMEYPGASRQRTWGASSFSADEWVEVDSTSEGPEGWPDWKKEDDVAFQQYLDGFF
jgi:hypothetical protein